MYNHRRGEERRERRLVNEEQTYLDVSKDSKNESQNVAQNQPSSPVIVDDGGREVAEIDAESEQNVRQDKSVEAVKVVVEDVA